LQKKNVGRAFQPTGSNKDASELNEVSVGTGITFHKTKTNPKKQPFSSEGGTTVRVPYYQTYRFMK